MPTTVNKKIFISLLDWGLGHACRVLPVIRKFNDEGYSVYIASSGRAKELLKRELTDCHFVDFPRYPVRYPRTRFFVTRFMLVIFPAMLITMWREHYHLKKLQKIYNFDLIISDNRFYAWHKNVPSFLISHQLRYKLPWPINNFEWLPEYFNYFFFRRYDKIIIPDNHEPESYTGQLSHKLRFLNPDGLYYAGILTSLVPEDEQITEIIDYLIIISGPEPQRSKFEQIIFKQVNQLKGNVVVALGLPEKNYKIRQGNAVFYTFMDRQQMSRYMQMARFIIGRPGYTSVMEMIELNKRGVFIPTPGQVEQVYLARYFEQQGWCHFVTQEKMNLAEAVTVGEKYPGFPLNESSSENNVDKLFSNIFNRIE